MAALAFAFTLSALLHGKASSRRATDAPIRSIAAGRRVHVAAVVMAALDRTFVSEVYDRISPSVALIMPRGVRNTSAQGSGFVVAVNGTRYILTSAHVAAQRIGRRPRTRRRGPRLTGAARRQGRREPGSS